MTRRYRYSALIAVLLLAAAGVTPLQAQTEEAAEGEEIEVRDRALPPVIDPETFNSQLRLDPVEIEAAPFQRIEDVLTSHVGVNKAYSGSDNLRFRGTGIDGTNFIVDGISQNNPYSNFPDYSINLDAIERVEVQTSGFTAEYGNVRSGVINITTKGDSGPPTLLNVDDAELTRVATAFVGIVQLRATAERGEISADQFQQRTIEAVTGQDLTLERYSEVIDAAQNNSKLQERLLNKAREVVGE